MNCYYTNMHMWKYRYISKNKLFSLYNATCESSRLNIWYLITKLCVLPWEAYFSQCQHSLVVYKSFCLVEDSRVFTHPLFLLLFSLLNSYLYNYFGKKCMGISSYITRRHNLRANTLRLWFFRTFLLHLPQCPWALIRHRTCYFYICIHCDCITNSAFSSVVAFYNDPCWDMMTTLICKYKYKCFIYS